MSVLSMNVENCSRLTMAAPDGARIPVLVGGSSSPLVILIHGWACRADFWSAQIGPLSRHARVAAPDLPGHGSADPRRPSGIWSIEGFGADILAVADALGTDEVVLVGHSMGGAVAIEAARLLGSRCRLLVGVDTFTEAMFYARRPEDEIANRISGFRGDFPGRMRGMIDAITGGDVDPKLKAMIAEGMAASDPEAALGVLEALLRWDIAAVWPLPGIPAVAINSAMLARRNELLTLDNLEIILMEGPGHFPMMEAPAAFNALLLEVLGVPPSGRADLEGRPSP
jgi:pimeloyl-ACP methyl ester carboxylesterase